MMKTMIIILTLGSFFLIVFSPVPAQAATIDLIFQGNVLSANLKEAHLKDILERFKKEKGISWKGSPSLLEEKITVRFIDLSLNEGLKRILGSMNHSLIFDEHERLASVIIIGSKTNGKVTSKSRMVAQNKRTQRSQAKEIEKSSMSGHRPPIVSADIKPPRLSPEDVAEKMENLKVRKNCPTPGGLPKVSKEDLENLNAVNKLPPLRGNVNEEDLEKLKPNKSMSPSGNSFNVSKK